MSEPTDPISFEGTRIIWLWKSDDLNYYNQESVFLSEELNDAYGTHSVHIDEETIPGQLNSEGSLEKVSVSGLRSSIAEPSSNDSWLVSKVADEFGAASFSEEHLIKMIITDDLREELAAGNVSAVYSTSTSSVSSINPKKTHGSYEDQLRQSNTNLSTQPSSSDYSGPLFAYAIDKREGDSDEPTLLERKSPINVAWEDQLRLSAVDVCNKKRTTWNGQHNIAPRIRHVILSNQSGYTLSSQDDDAGDALSNPFAQWHVRAFNIPRTMDGHFTVAGQAHKDPWDHNQLPKMLRNPNWHFAKARQKVDSDWTGWNRTISTFSVGNQDNFSSSNGEQALVGP